MMDDILMGCCLFSFFDVFGVVLRGIIRGITWFFAWIGRTIKSAFQWLISKISRKRTTDEQV